jgi:glucokinase
LSGQAGLKENTMIVLAGDIGGTNSRFALYQVPQNRQPTANDKPILEKVYPSAEHGSLEEIVRQFMAESGHAAPQAAALAVAGPIENDIARITNLPWTVDAARLGVASGIGRVTLVNDFEAAACAVPLLGAEHVVKLNDAIPQVGGPIAVTGPGTGLGQAFLFWSPGAQRYEVHASEGGHADFAPRTPIERGLLGYLAHQHGRVSYERVLSGPGLRNVFAYLDEDPSFHNLVLPETRAAFEKEDPAAVIVRQAVAGRDPTCLVAVNIFTSVLGAHAGNLALTLLASGGVFIAGGITPRLLDIIDRTPLRQAFETKGRLSPLLLRTPLYVVKHRELGLLGAASLAMR